MRFCNFASGSSGNCSLLSIEGTHILIDAGISMRRIKEGLTALGLSFADLQGVLVTHEHTDHIAGLPMLVKYHSMPIFAPRRLANHLCYTIFQAEKCISEIETGRAFKVGDMEVLAFNTPHDTPQSVGFRFEADTSFGYCTDLGHVSGEIRDALLGVKAAFIESNHDMQMLQEGPYPFFLKKRIFSEKGHLSNESCGEFAADLAEQGAKRLILGHLSRENNRPELASKTVLRHLNERGYEEQRDIELSVAPPSGLTAIEL